MPRFEVEESSPVLALLNREGVTAGRAVRTFADGPAGRPYLKSSKHYLKSGSGIPVPVRSNRADR